MCNIVEPHQGKGYNHGRYRPIEGARAGITTGLRIDSGSSSFWISAINPDRKLSVALVFVPKAYVCVEIPNMTSVRRRQCYASYKQLIFLS
jgi:hypothetical protein